ncbi:hypothetical protein D9V29_03035 [Mycetocola manganoxydans]|uniref:Uncharacterized protein n=1 Tax=Mycetocola manganoxydans TaxID=699879 RepID=A0A3L6ZZ60_9MICO|nr:hypothetical protein [Mycetocola manganoxydans]RLP72995.1 hypothetical protein D9V29_03035 [Mycetocola manganoxydans]GHD44632.1 hypothetical protein GCM10008097_12840 [Mycetocola manganoxydans]
MSDSRDIEDQLKINDADGEVSPADRTEAGVNTGSESADAGDENLGALGDVAHPFDQTNGILDDFDETKPGNVSGEESASEFAASADPGMDSSQGAVSADSYLDDDDTGAVPPRGPVTG